MGCSHDWDLRGVFEMCEESWAAWPPVSRGVLTQLPCAHVHSQAQPSALPGPGIIDTNTKATAYLQKGTRVKDQVICGGLVVAIVAVYMPGNWTSMFHSTRKQPGEMGEGPCGPPIGGRGWVREGCLVPPAPNLPIIWVLQPKWSGSSPMQHAGGQ